MKGALPPSSSDSRLIPGAAAAIRLLPVAVDPVRLKTRTCGCAASTGPTTLPFPGTIWSTPAGSPASARIGARASATSGVASAGFQTAVHPAASAAATFFAP